MITFKAVSDKTVDIALENFGSSNATCGAYKCGMLFFVNVGEGNVAAKTITELKDENAQLKVNLSSLEARVAKLEGR